MKRPSYRSAVRWIADNDEPRFREVEDIASLATAQLVGDIFGIEPIQVGRDVVARRVKDAALGVTSQKW